MSNKLGTGGLLLVLLFLAETVFAAPVGYKADKASFYQMFDGKDYYADGIDLTVGLGTMSGDGKVVAFYGNTYFNSTGHYKLFIHNFESTAEPVEVTLPSAIGFFNSNAGMVSNADGSRIFFVANDNDSSGYLFGMVNGHTGVVTILLRFKEIDVENPQDIGTDAAGEYLYFNEGDHGDRGNLWRIQASEGAVPELVIEAGAVGHPSGGVGRFVDQFDISDDGTTIAFFIEGRIKPDGTAVRSDKELFVKTISGIRFLTNNDVNSKEELVISGDSSTIVYRGSGLDVMVTAPDAAVESQINIEPGYQNCGGRPGITRDGSVILVRTTVDGTSSCNAYLVKTDGSSRKMIEPPQISIRETPEGLHLSDDGSRVFFKNRRYVYPDDWYNMTVAHFGDNLWPEKVPQITAVNYPSDFFDTLENNERFEISIGVSDPQGDTTVENVKQYTLFPDGYEDGSGSGPIDLFMDSTPVAINLYSAKGKRGSAWPDRVPVLTARFSVEDEDGNVGYLDTPLTVKSFSWGMFLPSILGVSNTL